jgi:predicted AAA+ superfamily ATPase
MFKRALLKELEKWRQNTPRKPLVIRGARQVGKTTLVNQFAAQYEQYIYI